MESGSFHPLQATVYRYKADIRYLYSVIWLIPYLHAVWNRLYIYTNTHHRTLYIGISLGCYYLLLASKIWNDKSITSVNYTVLSLHIGYILVLLGLWRCTVKDCVTSTEGLPPSSDCDKWLWFTQTSMYKDITIKPASPFSLLFIETKSRTVIEHNH